MDHLLTVSCQGTPGNLRALRVCGAWRLHLQRWQLEQGRFTITYRRPCLNYEPVSTWCVGYHLLEALLAHSANEANSAEVRLQFSPFKTDEALLTSAEVQADAPCTCHGEQGSVASSLVEQQCAWEAETLSFLPHVSSLVSEANPEPWLSWLPKRCKVLGEGNGVIWYCSVNCHYLLFHQRIISNYGYHGEAVFKTLQCYRCRRRMLREWAHIYAYMVRSNEEWKNRHG